MIAPVPSSRLSPNSRVAPEELGDSIIRHFERTVAAYPASIAVRDDAGALTYAQLNGAANRLAHELLEKHPGGPEDPVAFLLSHDKSSLVAMLGILKAGRPYVALHASNPPERLLRMLADSGSTCLLTARAFAPVAEALRGGLSNLKVIYRDDLPDTSWEVHDPGLYVPGTAPFTINYTSGSTGDPKGLLLSHDNISFCCLREARDWDITHEDRTALVFSISFGAAYACIMNAFLRGGALCLFDFGARGPDSALDWIRHEQITILRITPSMWRAMFVRAAPDLLLPSLRIISLGGEAARTSDAEPFKRHTLAACELQNTFASSEAGVVTLFRMGHETVLTSPNLPAGPPIPGHEVTIVDDEDSPLGVGEIGEIVIRSRHLHKGYWRNPGLTAERYVQDAADPSIRTLHSGDLGRWMAEGMLEYMGRKDSMVKIRGYRVEPAEVELHLRSSGLVGDVAVIARSLPNLPGHTQLVGYLTPSAARSIDLEAVRNFLGSRLPEYSIPSAFVIMDSLPINAHGKVDKGALPEPAQRQTLAAEDLPADVSEQALAKIWSSILQLETISVHDDFFELGGDSLSVLSMMLEVEKEFGRDVSRDFFRKPTIRALAGLLAQPAASSDGHTAAFRPADSAHASADRAASGGRRLFHDLRRGAMAARRYMDEVHTFEWILSRFTRRQSLEGAKALVARLAKSDALLDTIYRRRHGLFRRFLASLALSPRGSKEKFRQAFIGNLLFKLIDERRPFSKEAGWRFWDERRRMLESMSLGQLDEHFPVSGLEHLQTAYAEGRGVILLSYHGNANARIAHPMLSLRLGGIPIQSVAHNMAVEASGFRGARELMPAAVAGSLYAQLAHHGQTLLKRGGIAHILGDTFAPGPGRTHHIQVGDRRYEVKPGFAELALNTGSAVVPFFGRFIDGGRLLLEFLPPLDPERGTRDEQIGALLIQYAAFIERTMRQYPEMLLWKRMRAHLNHARA